MSATLNFFYGTMAAGKSLELIRLAGNLKMKNKNILIFNSSLDNRFGYGKVASRLKIEKTAIPYDSEFNFVKYFRRYKKSLYPSSTEMSAIFVDEAQFLTKKQVEELQDIVSAFKVNVYCYGLKTNYKGELFEGAKRLLEISDNISEIDSYCWCGKKATMNARLEDYISIGGDNPEILIGTEDVYSNVCYNHFLEGKLTQ